MPTIFTIPKPFTDQHIKIIQTNAIKSWTKLGPDFEIFLMGEEPGMDELSAELNITQIKEVKKNEFGTPILSSAFQLARERSRFDILIYANSDIIFTKNFPDAFKYFSEKFIACGRRWDVDVTNPITFSSDWEKKLMNSAKLHSTAGIDFYIFPKDIMANLPDFAVGRVGWDNWVIYNAKKSGIPIIDITNFTNVIHQNHSYPSYNRGMDRKTNPEAKKNRELGSRFSSIYNLEDANYKLTKHGIKVNYARWYSFLKRYIKYKISL